METEAKYESPVDVLLTLGEVPFAGEWIDYEAYGLQRHHIPALVRIATDSQLHWAESDEPEVWAPIHSWRALGQLCAAEAVVPLLELLDEYEDADWMHEEIPVVVGMIGASAIAPTRDFLVEPHRELYARVGAAFGLAEIGKRNPSCREECVEVLTASLRNFAQHDPTLNAF